MVCKGLVINFLWSTHDLLAALLHCVGKVPSANSRFRSGAGGRPGNDPRWWDFEVPHTTPKNVVIAP
jgi:hypothetical protein